MQNKTRDQAFDALRTLAIFLMIGSHISRVIAKEAWIFWNEFVLLIEPFTASSFLFLVGTSLVFSYTKDQKGTSGKPQRWFLRKVKRSFFIWIISFVMCFILIGIVWPDTFFLSGILATIAYALSAYSFLFMLPFTTISVISLTAALTIAFILFDHLKVLPYFLMDGNFPVLPLTLFTGIGVLFAIWLPLLRGRIRKIVTISCIVSLIIPFLIWGPQKVFSKPLGRYGIKRKVEAVFSPRDLFFNRSASTSTTPKTLHYYNLRPILLPVITSILVLLYFILTIFFSIIKSAHRLNNILKKILALGRNSLEIYILHLAILGIFIGRKSAITNHWKGILTWIFVLAACYIYALIREEFMRRKIAG